MFDFGVHVDYHYSSEYLFACIFYFSHDHLRFAFTWTSSISTWSIGLHLAGLTKLVGGILPKTYTKIFIFWYLLFNTPLVELWCLQSLWAGSTGMSPWALALALVFDESVFGRALSDFWRILLSSILWSRNICWNSNY